MVSSHADGFWFCLPTLRYPSLSLLSPAHKSGREWNFICVAQCHICHVYVYTWHICYTKFYCIIDQTTQSFGTLNQICGWLDTTKYRISSSCFSIDYINWPFFNVKDIPISFNFGHFTSWVKIMWWLWPWGLCFFKDFRSEFKCGLRQPYSTMFMQRRAHSSVWLCLILARCLRDDTCVNYHLSAPASSSVCTTEEVYISHG